MIAGLLASVEGTRDLERLRHALVLVDKELGIPLVRAADRIAGVFQVRLGFPQPAEVAR